MGLFDRFRRVVKSNINDMISKAENPEKMLTQLIEDMNGQLIESKKAVASAIADEKQLERQLLQQRTQAEDWEKRAVLAVQEGQDDLAKRALVRKQELDEYVSSYQDQWQAQSDSVEQLKGSLRDLTQKIEEAQRKKNILIARAKRAEAQQRIQSTLSTSRDTSAFEAFDRMSKKVDQIEAQADAEREIGELDAGDKSLEREFKQLEGGDTSGDKLLENLKRKMGQIEDKSSETESQGTSPGG
ncbi:MAG: PspA/IM30 family protein [Spirochaetaceae bacterium]|nr:PspA/IM30 family protein [Spirochaetaceae bacterium]